MLEEQRFRIRHPSIGWLVSMVGTGDDSYKYREKWTKNESEAEKYSLAELRRPMDANGNGMMSILVKGYTGLTIEMIEEVRKRKPSLSVID